MTLMELIDAALRAATAKATAASIWSDSSAERREYCEAYDEARTAVVEAVEKLERDAARYRWLRDDVRPVYARQQFGEVTDYNMKWQIKTYLTAVTAVASDVSFNEAIDKAMGATNGQGN